MTNLPKWLPLSDCRKIFSIIENIGGESRLVGGCVRDILLGKNHTDIDIATTALPEQVLNALNSNKIKVIPTGLKHGTVTAIINDKNYEITTLRKDIETDGRHAVVAFTNSWQEDAKRRDFTINSMSMDLTGKLFDYFNGQEDLKTKLVKFVGSPEKRIEEDYLRILRYFRFISYFGTEHLHKPSLKACLNLAKGLNKISGERIRVEMLKILASPFAAKTILLMNDGVLEKIGVSNIDPNLANYIFTDNPYINFAIILRASNFSKKDLVTLKSRWKLSKKEKFNLETLIFLTGVSFDLPDFLHKRAIYNYGKETYINFIRLLNVETPSNKASTLIKNATEWQIPEFEINGENIIKLGYNGQQVGKILKKLHQIWIESDFELNKEQLLNRVKNAN